MPITYAVAVVTPDGALGIRYADAFSPQWAERVVKRNDPALTVLYAVPKGHTFRD